MYKIKREFINSSVSLFGKGTIILTESLPKDKLETLYKINHPAIEKVEKPKDNENKEVTNK